jgi:hypothetical protein
MESFAELSQWYVDRWVETYYIIKYGHHWRWYYLNWEMNREFLY